MDVDKMLTHGLAVLTIIATVVAALLQRAPPRAPGTAFAGELSPRTRSILERHPITTGVFALAAAAVVALVAYNVRGSRRAHQGKSTAGSARSNARATAPSVNAGELTKPAHNISARCDQDMNGLFGLSNCTWIVGPGPFECDVFEKDGIAVAQCGPFHYRGDDLPGGPTRGAVLALRRE